MRVSSRTTIAPIAAFALLLHALLPFFAVYQLSAARDAASVASVFGDRILLHTIEGFRFVHRDALAEHGKHEHHRGQYQCALCYVAAHGTGVAPPPSATILPPSPYDAAIATPQSDVLAKAGWRKFLARSPPSPFRA